MVKLTASNCEEQRLNVTLILNSSIRVGLALDMASFSREVTNNFTMESLILAQDER